MPNKKETNKKQKGGEKPKSPCPLHTAYAFTKRLIPPTHTQKLPPKGLALSITRKCFHLLLSPETFNPVGTPSESIKLTCHHCYQAGFVDVGERAELPCGQDGFEMSLPAGLPKLADFVIEGWRRKSLRRLQSRQCLASPQSQKNPLQTEET